MPLKEFQLNHDFSFHDFWNMILSISSSKKLKRLKFQTIAIEKLMKISSKFSQSVWDRPQLNSFHHLWNTALLVPKANMFRRFAPQLTAVGGLSRIPPRFSQPSPEGPQVISNHSLYAFGIITTSQITLESCGSKSKKRRSITVHSVLISLFKFDFFAIINLFLILKLRQRSFQQHDDLLKFHFFATSIINFD